MAKANLNRHTNFYMDEKDYLSETNTCFQVYGSAQ